MTARAEDSYAAITTIVVHSSAFIDPNSALLDLDQHDLYCWKWKRSTLCFLKCNSSILLLVFPVCWLCLLIFTLVFNGEVYIPTCINSLYTNSLFENKRRERERDHCMESVTPQYTGSHIENRALYGECNTSISY